MGDFDRKDKKAGNDQSKQITIMILLGVVLIGVVGYHFSKGGPSPSAASANAGGIPMPVIDETPEQASNALKQDPTASLLRQTQEVDTTLDKVPRNPFLMGEAWRMTLVRDVEPVSTPVTPVNTTPIVRNTERKVIPAPKADNFKLASIVRQGGTLSAIINGRIVGVGAVVGDARVVEISEGRVVLQNADFADGPKTELTLSPQLKQQ